MPNKGWWGVRVTIGERGRILSQEFGEGGWVPDVPPFLGGLWRSRVVFTLVNYMLHGLLADTSVPVASPWAGGGPRVSEELGAV